MTLDTTDVELYLKKQAACPRMKLTNFMESYSAACLYSIALVFLLMYVVMQFLYRSEAHPSAQLTEFMALGVYAAWFSAILLTVTVMFFSGWLPRYNAMMSVDDIQRMYASLGREYGEMNYPPADERPAIDYLNTLIETAIPMDVTHLRRARQLMHRDVKADDLRARNAKAKNALLNASSYIAGTDKSSVSDDKKNTRVSGKIVDQTGNETIGNAGIHE
ncbi:hypothetical protein OND84_004202 [Morganella morganii]|uniref:hypothetical protein n=1 Tax=Providencia TaxID=586 RepID=UPI00234A98C4|nr:hypothetical protein [Providencia sp. PROV255]EMB6211549.1 hypothetical protein [Morganella morganii]EMB6212882.1 hypothetical protein [Morganella morganii]